MYLVRRERGRKKRAGPSLFIAYLFWLTAGFLGIHRFYVRSAWGAVFIPVFLAIIYCNGDIRDAREDSSRTMAAVAAARVAVEQSRPAADAAADAQARFAAANETLKRSEKEYAVATAAAEKLHRIVTGIALVLALMLLVDAALLPGLVRRRAARESADPTLEVVRKDAPVPPADVATIGTGEDPTLRLHTRFTDAIEKVNVWVGEYVAYWAIISVFIYYYEVVARFVFNSPTNWVHESMFLMFGMQYMLCGAYAYREDQHVRVDVVYTKFSRRGKALADIVTSLFFFIFIGTMLWTGARFALDSISFNEHSFTEWGIQYWPVKLAIPIGAAMLFLQGVSRLIKDVMIVTHREA
jgi:TRAP-type mannitol/chloroaromatic compound transport system permease small subunit